MKVSILCVGGVKGGLARVIQEYEERVAHYWRFRVEVAVGGIGKSAKPDPREVLKAEASRLLDRIPSGGEVVAVTRDGKAMGSRDLARFLEDCSLRSVPDVTFVIGGAYGLGEAVLKRSTRRLSLSAFTFPHEMARLLLTEQLYRAGSISRKEPYHKGP